MKKFNANSKKPINKARILAEDLKVLQKKISGRSVYAKYRKEYERRPKHRKFNTWQTI